jgi:hypothetical protein
MSDIGSSSKGAYQRQPAPGQDLDPRNPPIAHQDPAHADDVDKTSASSDDARGATACDYVDVVRLSDGQPRFLLQPHRAGGAVGTGAFTLEIEGARALVQHLKHALLEESIP